MSTLFVALFFLLVAGTPALSQTSKPSSPADLAAYTGADRERVLFDGAKREGKVVWYTTLAAEQNKQLAGAFEARYPGVKVDTFRTGSSALAQRLLTEAKAGRHIADAIETTLPGLLTFRDNQLLLPYSSPHLAAFPDEAREKAPKNLVYWTHARESYIGFAYNKNFVNGVDVPKNFEGLMRPALRDNMGLSGDDTGARIIGAMVRTKGDGFVRKLREQNIRMHMMAGSALTQLVAAGEIFASPSQFYSATNVAAKRGAPVAWVPLDLVVTNAGGAAVYARAQRPHAGLLFADFILSPEGQKLLENLYFGSAGKDYGFKRWYPEKGGTLALRRSVGRLAQAAQGCHEKVMRYASRSIPQVGFFVSPIYSPVPDNLLNAIPPDGEPETYHSNGHERGHGSARQNSRIRYGFEIIGKFNPADRRDLFIGQPSEGNHPVVRMLFTKCQKI